MTNQKEEIEAHLSAFGLKEEAHPVTRFTGVQTIEVEM